MLGSGADQLVSQAKLTGLATLALLAAMSLMPVASRAQAPAAIGALTGRDLSVENPAAISVNASEGTPVGNGSVVVVHSGKAQMQLTTGGTISICGPAKFTVLQSGDALTLALEFGSLHISLGNSTLLETYTPFFTVSSASTEEESREFTVGLDANGIFCARAIHGGVRLEQQLTGHLLVVPEPSEKFLRGGDITPLRDPPGHCECTVTSAELSRAPTPATETANATGVTERPPAVSASPSTSVSVANAVPESPRDAGSTATAPTLSSKPGATPSAAPSNTSATASAGTKVTLPALAFDYSAPDAVTIANPDTDALLEESQVTPNWVFHGTVGSRSTSVAPADPNTVNAAQARSQPHQSFWSKLKRFFGGV